MADQNYEAAIRQMHGIDTPETTVAEAPVETQELVTIPEEVTPTEQIVETAIVEDTPVETIPAVANQFTPETYLEKFGFKSEADLQAALAPKQPEFANEASKQLYDALLSGNEKEVADYLTKKQFAANLQDATPEQLIKAHIKATNPKFDAQDIEDEYQDRYTVDPLNVEDSKLSREQKKREQQLENDTLTAKQYFSQFENIQLPEPVKQQPVVSEQAKAALSFSDELNRNRPADVSNIPFEFNDQNANINLKGQVIIPSDKVAAIKTRLSESPEMFYQSRYITPEGQFNEDLHARDIYVLTHLNEVVTASVSDAYNQTRLEILKQNKNFVAPGSTPSGGMELSEEQQKIAAFENMFLHPSLRTA